MVRSKRTATSWFSSRHKQCDKTKSRISKLSSDIFAKRIRSIVLGAANKSAPEYPSPVAIGADESSTFPHKTNDSASYEVDHEDLLRIFSEQPSTQTSPFISVSRLIKGTFPAGSASPKSCNHSLSVSDSFTPPSSYPSGDANIDIDSSLYGSCDSYSFNHEHSFEDIDVDEVLPADEPVPMTIEERACRFFFKYPRCLGDNNHHNQKSIKQGHWKIPSPECSSRASSSSSSSSSSSRVANSAVPIMGLSMHAPRVTAVVNRSILFPPMSKFRNQTWKSYLFSVLVGIVTVTVFVIYMLVLL